MMVSKFYNRNPLSCSLIPHINSFKLSQTFELSRPSFLLHLNFKVQRSVFLRATFSSVSMAKVYPQAPSQSSPSPICSRRESFTIWMKSLIYHTNGCTVFDSNGDIVYRVDNYDRKCSDEVFLMDLRGKVLFTIRKKKFSVFGGWDGYRWIESERSKKPSFRVRKLYRKSRRDHSVCEISVGFERYSLVKMDGKLAFRIINVNGDVVAEAKRKLSSNGVLLGDDVLSLDLNSQIEHSLVMALVTVYGLIRRQM